MGLARILLKEMFPKSESSDSELSFSYAFTISHSGDEGDGWQALLRNRNSSISHDGRDAEHLYVQGYRLRFTRIILLDAHYNPGINDVNMPILHTKEVKHRKMNEHVQKPPMVTPGIPQSVSTLLQKSIHVEFSAEARETDLEESI